MKKVYLLVFFGIALFATNKAYEDSSTCKSCHVEIYNEFKGSVHANTTPSKDPIHNAMWKIHPANKKMNQYKCGKCHTPTANNLEDMLTKGKTALPDANNKTHQEAVSCAYCHRISTIQKHKIKNTNITNNQEKLYYGNLKEHIKSSFHEIDTNNENMKNSNICMGCHSHEVNKFDLTICSIDENNKTGKNDCISCHMPQVKGTVSNIIKRKTHAFHGFPGTHKHSKMLRKYIEISATKNKNGFEVIINNNTTHSLLLHPLRVGVLKMSISRNGKVLSIPKEVFVKIIGKDKKPAPPWIANAIIKDTMIIAKEKRIIQRSFKLKKGDVLKVELGWYLVNPKMIKKLNLENEKSATKFYSFKKKSFQIF